MTPQYLTARTRLRAQRQALATCILANESAPSDRIARAILDGLTTRARTYLARVETALRVVEAGGYTGTDSLSAQLGPNGRGPAIDELLKSSKWHREAALQAVAA